MSGRLFALKSRLLLELRLAMGSPAGALAFLALLGASAAALGVGMAEISDQNAEIERALAQQAEQRNGELPGRV